jgi:molybdopterin-containing oxidoreductase family iron-sulfur binding subunit
MQPTMARLLNSRLPGDIFMDLARAMNQPLKRQGDNASPENFQQWLRWRWQQLSAEAAGGGDFEEFWSQSLRRGGAWEKPKGQTTSRWQWPRSMVGDAAKGIPAWQNAAATKASAESVELLVWPTIMLFDGRLANRGWMQEIPEPVSFACWGSWVDIHPELAKRLGLEEEDLVELRSPHGQVENVPVRVTELQSPHGICLPLGQGHTAMGHNAQGMGVNAWRLLSPLSSGGREMHVRVGIRKTSHGKGPIFQSFTQDQHHREILQWTEVDKLHKTQWGQGEKLILPLPEGYSRDKDIYEPHEHAKYRWAMVIDLQRCIGCGACSAACYAENNIPVMGADYCRRRLEMTWLKVVPYRNSENENILGFLPLLCQHCDTGPCEPVCPVYAAVHNEEGLNSQIYNRCVGTRYCSNNCPYKVRRFNWFNIPLRNAPEAKPEWVRPLDWQLNPEVTVRVRGVMEKCTFCIQRIRQVQHQALLEGREVKDGEVQPACVQTCPAKVFTFGNLLDKNSQVSRLTRNDPRRYHVLEEQNTKPAITYLRRIMLE